MAKDNKKRSSEDVYSNSDKGKSKKEGVQQNSAQEPKRASYRERKEKMLNYMENIGSWVLPRVLAERFAEQFNISERQVYKDRLKIIRSVPKPKVNETSAKFLISFDHAMTEVMTLMRDNEPVIRARAIDLYFKSIEIFTRFMENFGFKEKVADDLNLHTSLSSHGEGSLMKILDKYIK